MSYKFKNQAGSLKDSLWKSLGPGSPLYVAFTAQRTLGHKSKQSITRKDTRGCGKNAENPGNY